MKITLDPEIASEAKALVALAFRNGPMPATLVNFVGAHLGLKNTLDQAKQEIDAAAKAAKAEARSKAKTPGTQPAAKPEVARPAETQKSAPLSPPQSVKTAGLFDAPEPGAAAIVDTDDEEEILTEAAREDQFIGED